MTKRAGSRKPGVIRASPVGQPPSLRQAARSSGPAARWMAPSTPPPPSSDVLAALTIASSASVVMSASRAVIGAAMIGSVSDSQRVGATVGGRRARGAEWRPQCRIAPWLPPLPASHRRRRQAPRRPPRSRTSSRRPAPAPRRHPEADGGRRPRLSRPTPSSSRARAPSSTTIRSSSSPAQKWKSAKPPHKLMTLEWLVEWLAGKLKVPYLHIDPLKIDLRRRHRRRCPTRTPSASASCRSPSTG